MPIEIISRRLKAEKHYHKCPKCRKLLYEPNEICGMSSGDHVFMCISCLQDVRFRLGTDVLIDAYLSHQQATALDALAPDAIARMLDERDNAERAKQVIQLAAKAAEEAKKPKPKQKVDPKAKKKARKEKFDHLMDTADKLTYDETVSEMEKIKEKERII